VYTVTPRASAGNLCYGDPFVITVPVTSVPTAPALSTVATNACSDVSFTIDPDTYITNGQTGGSYAWVGSYDAGLTVVTAGTSPGTITETIRNESGGALFATYTVTPTLGGCVAPSFDIRIRIESEPDAVDVTASAQCSDVSYTINPQSYITNGVASSFVWSAAPDPLLVLVSAGAGTGVITETYTNEQTGPLNVVYTVTPTATGGQTCAGDVFTITVPIKAEPNALASQTLANRCSDVGFTLTPQSYITNSVASSFTWTAAYGAGLSGGAGTGSGDISETLTNVSGATASVTYTVTPTGLNGCLGDPFDLVVPIEAEPVGTSVTAGRGV
jgi:hypothetical protein